MKRISAFLLGLMLFTAGCGDEATPTQMTGVEFTTTQADAAAKSDVCHVDEYGVYRLITIADAAYDKHLAHGDAAPGSDVPGMIGYVFSDDDCSPVVGYDVYGDVTWTAATRSRNPKPGITTQFAVNTDNTGFLRLEAPATDDFGNEGGVTTLTVECVSIEGNEAWVGGTIATGTGVYSDRVGEPILYWFKDNEATSSADELGGWGAKNCDDGVGTWQGSGVVTSGDLVVG